LFSSLYTGMHMSTFIHAPPMVRDVRCLSSYGLSKCRNLYFIILFYDKRVNCYLLFFVRKRQYKGDRGGVSPTAQQPDCDITSRAYGQIPSQARRSPIGTARCAYQ